MHRTHRLSSSQFRRTEVVEQGKPERARREKNTEGPAEIREQDSPEDFEKRLGTFE
jgi:hypothetical protein